MELSTENIENENIKQMVFNYTKINSGFFLGYTKKINIELKNVRTNEVKLRLSTDLEYSYNNIFGAKFDIENYLWNNFHHKFELERAISVSQSGTSYILADINRKHRNK